MDQTERFTFGLVHNNPNGTTEIWFSPKRSKSECAEIRTAKSSDFAVIRISDNQILDIHGTFHRKFVFKLVIALKLIKVGSTRQYEVK